MKKIPAPQDTIYHFICTYLQENGYPPTVREICSGVGLNSPATVHCHLKKLESAGLIHRDSKKHGYTVVGKANAAANIPLVGSVAAGTPIMAVENIEDRFPVPQILLQGCGQGDAFMLHVKGDSMVNAGIQNGDILVVSAEHQVYDGDIVVARIDGAEFTVKRLYHKGDSIELRPENDAYAPMLFSPSQVEIVGRVTGLMRPV